MASASIPLPSELCAPFDLDLDAILALVVELPGGIAIQGQFDPGDVPDVGAAASRLLAQLGAALGPLMPIFRLVECVVSAYECIKAIPDAIGPPPDPGALVNAIAKLTKCVDFLLSLVPQLTVPALVKTVLNAVIAALFGLREQLDNLELVSVDLDAKDNLAQTLSANFPVGAARLQVAVDCARASFDMQREIANRSACPINSLLGLLSLFLSLIGLPAVQPIAVDGDLSEARQVVTLAIATLTSLRDTIPALVTVEGC